MEKDGCGKKWTDEMVLQEDGTYSDEQRECGDLGWLCKTCEDLKKPQPCVYANSRYTTATNSPRRHIDNGSGKPLCQTSAKASISFTSSTDIPDCKRCIKIATKGKGLK